VTATLALFGGPPVRTRPFPSWPVFGEAEERRLLGVLRSGRWGRLDGAEVAEFERRFAEMHGCRHAIAVASGTVALRVALLAAGIEADDDVIVPAYTFVATATAVVEANAIPVFGDIDLETFNLDPLSVAIAITPRTRAIIPVHFAGMPADMDAICRLARENGLVVIEDAAHAHGAAFRNTPVGGLAHLAAFSFQSSKNMTAGEGGIITTNDDRLAEACRSIQNCGRVPGGVWYEHHAVSGNYRLGEFQGAVLNAQLDRLQEQIERREFNGQRLAKRLDAVPGLYPQGRTSSCTRHSYHLFMLRLDPEEFGAPRDAVLRALEAEGIPCSAGYGFPLPDQPLFRNKAFGPYLPRAAARLDYSTARCPNARAVCAGAIWLGQNLLLGDWADVDDIADAFEKIHAHRASLAAC
jgi:dTDP-4-amino-4,6-dideoxygalactose transaminase